MVEGIGTEQNLGEAERFFRRSADAGYAVARAEWAILYKKNVFGRDPDPLRSSSVWLEEFENGNPVALYDVGLSHFWGTDGVERDMVKGIDLLERAAAADHNLAMAFLGKAYLYGNEVEKDEEKAFTWLSRAAQKGAAFYDLAYLHGQEEGKYADAEEAAIWLMADLMSRDSFYITLENKNLFSKEVVVNVQKFLAVNGFYDGPIEFPLSERAVSAIHRFEVDAYPPYFSTMVSKYRALKQKEREVIGAALDRAVDRWSADRRSQSAIEAEQIVINRPFEGEGKDEWLSYLTDIQRRHRYVTVDGFKYRDVAEINGDWVKILAVDPTTSTIYYARSGYQKLLANKSENLRHPDLPPPGDHSKSGPVIVLDRRYDQDDPQWNRWFQNLRLAFRSKGEKGLVVGEIAYLEGLLGDPEVLIVAHDDKRKQYYIIWRNDMFLYRVGADYMVTAAESRGRDAARGLSAIGLAICAMSGTCAE
ncbi:sel1 repeat family protein [Paracoccus sp. XHP0099]|uniref:Sel1 repeat family protein n=2 Tax=Paracoccus marinaquae TaxID=2841926 RepID=A0ABS6APJ7_9RHOB|nr:sel1 repeat family protein [Paracoccus marinaquae]